MVSSEIDIAEKITQLRKTHEILESVAQQAVMEDDIVASLNLAIEDGQGIVELKGNTVTIESDNFKLTENGTLTCNNANINGILTNYNKNGKKAISIVGNHLNIYDWKDTGERIGFMTSTVNLTTNIKEIAIGTLLGNNILIGYRESQSDTVTLPLMRFTTNDLTKTPWVKNTANGTIFSNAGGIEVENGFIKNWNLNTISTAFTLTLANGKYLELVISNGLITSARQIN